MRKDPSGKTFLYDPDEPDWASSYNQAQLDMIHRIGIDEFASYDSWVQDAMLYSALMGEPYVPELYTTQVEDPLTVYKDNLISAVIGEELGSKDYMMVGPVINTASTTNSFISDIQSDMAIYKNPRDLLTAVGISAASALLDTGLGFILKVSPPIGALISTAIYYTKQGAKLIWIGY